MSQDVVKVFENFGLYLINTPKTIAEKCYCIDEDGYMVIQNQEDIKRGSRGYRYHRSNPFSIQNIIYWISINNKNFILKEGQVYNKNNAKLIWICNEHGEFSSTWADIQSHKGCPNCAKNKKLDIDIILKRLSKISTKIRLIDREYINSKSPMMCECIVCGNKWSTNWNNLSQGYGCNICAINSRTGELNCRYNPNLTDEQRRANESRHSDVKYKIFVRKVKKTNGDTCVVCGSKDDIRVHHLNGFGWFESGRLDVNNATLLCKECHDINFKGSFHNIYGNGNNTAEQFYEFLKQKKDGAICSD